MGKVIGLLIGVIIWAAIGYYVTNTWVRIVCMGAVIYLTAIYLLSLKKKGGSDEFRDPGSN